MATAELPPDALKEALKQALSETLYEQREFFRELFEEVFEDLALVEAIREGEKTERVDPEPIFEILEGKA